MSSTAGDGLRARDGLSRRADSLLCTLHDALRDAQAAAVAAAAEASSSSSLSPSAEVSAREGSWSGLREGSVEWSGCGASRWGAGGSRAGETPLRLPKDPFGGATVSSGCSSPGQGEGGGEVSLVTVMRAVADEVAHHVGGGAGVAGSEQGAMHSVHTLAGSSIRQVARVGAAAGGFLRMCESAQSHVREQQCAQAVGLEGEARETLSALCSLRT